MKLHDAIEAAGEGGTVTLGNRDGVVPYGIVTKLTNTAGEWDVRWQHQTNATKEELESDRWIGLPAETLGL